jgi:hypothetical protein
VSSSPELKRSHTLEVCQTRAEEHGGCQQASSSMPPFAEPCDGVHSSSQDVLQAELGEPVETNFEYCNRPSERSLPSPEASAPLHQNQRVHSVSGSAIPRLDMSDTIVSNGPLDDCSGSGGCQSSTAHRRRGSDRDAAADGRQHSSEDYQSIKSSSTRAYVSKVTQKALDTELEQNAGLLQNESDGLRLRTISQTGPEGGTISGAGSSVERKKRLAEKLVSLPRGRRTQVDAGRGIIKDVPGSPTQRRRLLGAEKTVANYSDLSSGLSNSGYSVLRITSSFAVTQALTVTRSVTIKSDTTLCAGGRCTISGNVSWSPGFSGLTKLMLSWKLYCFKL